VPGINYETVFIAEPEIPTEQVDQLIGKIKETIEAHKGSVTSEDRWGRRRLAYPLRGNREGFYTVLNFTAEPTVIRALEHLYNVTDSVIRQLTIRHYPSKKKFAPRRERPAGADHRGGRPGSGSFRPRSDAPRSAAPAPAAEATPAPAPTPAPEAAPQGDKA
jgi:small subunit ribosomal protein S6